jgi:hypothetical protein
MGMFFCGINSIHPGHMQFFQLSEIPLCLFKLVQVLANSSKSEDDLLEASSLFLGEHIKYDVWRCQLVGPASEFY